MALYAETRGTGHPVICLPPFAADRSMMIAALEPAFVGSANWQRTYVDLPGCGRSPAGPEHSDGVVDAVLDLIDRRYGDRGCLLAGWSYGGYLAAALARRQPWRFGGLLLICPGVRAAPADRTLPPAPTDPGPDGWLRRVPAHLVDQIVGAVGNRRPEVAERVAAALAAMEPTDTAYLDRLRSGGFRLSDEGSAVGYPGPVCLVTGRDDRVAGHADQYAALAGYPAATFVAMAGAGHYLPFEQPVAFRGLVSQWLARCSSGLGVAAPAPGRRWPA